MESAAATHGPPRVLSRRLRYHRPSAQQRGGVMFAAGTYADRRARLAAAAGSGVLVFLGNGESPMNYTDNTYPFRQDSTWLYYFGIDRAGLAALVDIDEHRTVVFGNDLTLDDIVWTGPQPTVAELAARAGVTESAPSAALADALDRA